MAARLRGIPVLHVFRDSGDESRGQSRKRSSLDKLQWLPASMYPEYHKVFEMMADGGRNYPLYKSLPDHVVVEFIVGADKYTRTKTRKVTLCTPQGRLVSYRVSFAAVLIGGFSFVILTYDKKFMSIREEGFCNKLLLSVIS